MTWAIFVLMFVPSRTVSDPSNTAYLWSKHLAWSVARSCATRRQPTRRQEAWQVWRNQGRRVTDVPGRRGARQASAAGLGIDRRMRDRQGLRCVEADASPARACGKQTLAVRARDQKLRGHCTAACHDRARRRRRQGRRVRQSHQRSLHGMPPHGMARRRKRGATRHRRNHSAVIGAAVAAAILRACARLLMNENPVRRDIGSMAACGKSACSRAAVVNS